MVSLSTVAEHVEPHVNAQPVQPVHVEKHPLPQEAEHKPVHDAPQLAFALLVLDP